MWKEFKEFAVKGNAIDLAVGVIIGAAFGKIITSIVEDLIMPPVGKLIGNLDFTNLYIPLSDKITPGMALAEVKKAGLPVFAYGNFITVTINFLIVAFCIFMVVKAMNKMKRPSPTAAPVAKDCPACAMSIPIKATRCPHCTTELSRPPATRP
jgi:large conductance mechanosensitive channel